MVSKCSPSTLTEFGKVPYSLLLIYYKECNSGTTKWKRYSDQGMGKEHGVFRPSLGMPPFQHHHVFTNVDVLWAASGKVFMLASLCRHDWLNYWPLVVNSVSSSQAESSNLLIKRSSNQEISSPGNQPLILRGFSSHHINITSGVVEKGLLWITRDTPSLPPKSYFRGQDKNHVLKMLLLFLALSKLQRF